MKSENQLAGRIPPLTTYDLLGYLVPGGALIVLCATFEYYARTIIRHDPAIVTLHTPVLTAIRVLQRSLGAENWVTTATFSAVMLAGMYFVGHLSGALSSIVVDKIFVRRGYGYPYEQLLRLRKPSGSELLMRAYHRGLLFWFTVFALGVFISEVPSGVVSPRLVRFAIAVPGVAALLFVIATTSFLMLLAYRRSAVTPKLTWVHSLGRRTAVRAAAWLLLRFFWSGLYDVSAYILSRYLRTRDAFSEEFIDQFRAEMKMPFHLSIESAGTNNFWIPYLTVKTSSPSLDSLASNWLNLYGFARNLATSFYLGFLYALVWLKFQSDVMIARDAYTARMFAALPIVYLSVSAILLMNYYNLYVAYFSKFILRAFVFVRATQPTAQGRVPEASAP